MAIISITSVKLFVYILLSIALLKVSKCQEIAPEIRLAPSSILVPLWSSAVFDCRAYCSEACSINWNINGYTTLHEHQRNRFIQKGFIFSYSHPSTPHGIYKSTLSVNASVLVNNTQLYCFAENDNFYSTPVTSGIATLLVTSGSLVKPNPLVVSQPTSFLLKWSPPYLWPGQRVKYYNVLITNTRDNTTTSALINATFSDLVVTHEEFPPDHECTEYLFEISAVNSSNGVLPTFTVTGRYQRGTEEFGTPSLNTTTYFTSNLTPVVRMSIQPPPRICYYQELNYTIIVSPLNYSNESDTWFIEFGPFHHRGNGTVKHDITSEKLIANEEYSLQLVLATYFDTVTVGNHYFDTYFRTSCIATPTTVKTIDESYSFRSTDNHNDTHHDQNRAIPIAYSFSLTFGLLILLMVILVITTTAYAKKRAIITEENDAYGMHECVQTGANIITEDNDAYEMQTRHVQTGVNIITEDNDAYGMQTRHVQTGVNITTEDNDAYGVNQRNLKRKEIDTTPTRRLANISTETNDAYGVFNNKIPNDQFPHEVLEEQAASLQAY